MSIFKKHIEIDPEVSSEIYQIHGDPAGHEATKFNFKAFTEAELEDYRATRIFIDAKLKMQGTPSAPGVFNEIAEVWAAKRATEWYQDQEIYTENKTHCDPKSILKFMSYGNDHPFVSQIPKEIMKLIQEVPTLDTMNKVADNAMEIAKWLDGNQSSVTVQMKMGLLPTPATVQTIQLPKPEVPEVHDVEGFIGSGNTRINIIPGEIHFLPKVQIKTPVIANVGMGITNQAWRLNLGHTKVFINQIEEEALKQTTIAVFLDLTVPREKENLCHHCHRNDNFRNNTFRIAKLISDSAAKQKLSCDLFAITGYKTFALSKLGKTYYPDFCEKVPSIPAVNFISFYKANYDPRSYLFLLYNRLSGEDGDGIKNGLTSLLAQSLEANNQLFAQGYRAINISVSKEVEQLQPNMISLVEKDCNDEAKILAKVQEGISYCE